MHFNTIRITGFKSFVEPTDVVISEGLTGIVGPNGCGKSNVVESLRWAMGENSARRLRGGEMDDVIFSGSAGRPARNIAEVTILLDNTQRTALAEFNHDDQIEVTRRIERGLGSDYRVNGRPVRQKDVQLLFADQATGAHSTSIVSQGRVSSLIQAKPQERRQVLEEAAGISGLHARRHEAELKLKGAEGNLTRVDDQVQAMDTQLRSLKAQVRQASRYRNLGDLIKKAEAGLLYLKTKQAEVNWRLMEDNFSESEARVRELTSLVAAASTRVAEKTALLPPLRQAEAAASAVVQRIVLERESLERDMARLAAEQQRLADRIAQTDADRSREEALASDAQEARQRLDEEGAQLEAKAAELGAAAPSLEAKAEEQQQRVSAREKAAQEDTEALARAREQKLALEREQSALAARRQQLEAKAAEVAADMAALEETLSRLPSLTLAQSLVDATEADIGKKQQAADAAREARSTAERQLNAARDQAQKADVEKAKLQAEAEALQKLLQHEEATGTPLSDRITVEPGYEAALAAALADTLSAPLDAAATYYWQDLGAFDETRPLPAGTEALSRYVEAPPALTRALSQIALVETEAQGAALAKDLKAGQILVSRKGAAWRWDGYTQQAEALTPAAARLQQRNRLAELQALTNFSEQKAAAAQAQLQEAQTAMENAAAADQQAQQAQSQAFTALNAARRDYAEQAQAQAQSQSQLARYRETTDSLAEDRKQVAAQLEQLAQTTSALPNVDELSAAMQTQRAELASERQQLAETQGARASLSREIHAAKNRQQACIAENENWRQRMEQVATRLVDLKTRAAELAQEAEALATKPAEMAAQKQALLSRGQEAESQRAKAADELLAAETEAGRFEKDMRSQEEALMQAKENRVRTEEQMGQARLSFDELVMRAREHWHCAPDELLAKIEVKDASELASVDQLEHDFARFSRERENMGPVNLRAELESEELQAQIDKMTAEKEELVSAIAKLRQGIGTLNKEARERLQQAFEQVNTNFSGLFTRLFGGGKAHLQLIDSDDPLEAGLEIFACPPGKRLQALSLLSGGEQALTALSLLFAIFLVNPSPICVLDEVDAPLDEANVDRYCSMLREMGDQGKTRFLIITHHRLTMARMDRLYGVTMAEKGVSQLVSVDLKQALAMREANPENAAVDSQRAA
jgi:chromosome segregation protein